MKEIDQLRDISVYGKIILKWIIKKRSVRVWTRFIWLRTVISSRLL
jgi:hypothetical protein